MTVTLLSMLVYPGHHQVSLASQTFHSGQQKIVWEQDYHQVRTAHGRERGNEHYEAMNSPGTSLGFLQVNEQLLVYIPGSLICERLQVK